MKPNVLSTRLIQEISLSDDIKRDANYVLKFRKTEKIFPHTARMQRNL